MKKNLPSIALFHNRPGAIICTILILFCSFLPFAAQAQTVTDAVLEKKVTIKFENTSILDVLGMLKKQAGINFMCNNEEMKDLPAVSGNYTNATVGDVLTNILKAPNFTFSVVNNTVVISRSTKVDRITIFGQITDENKLPLPGASVILKGTPVGVTADNMGRYKISFAPSDNMTLVFRFLGSQTKELAVTKSTELNVRLVSDVQKIDDIVVTGLFERNTATFTGSVTSLKGEDLLAISTTDLFTAIAALTPGMVMVQNNYAGSNPNKIPEIIIRGATSLVTSTEQAGLNNPLIVLDGVEITLEELYDLDMFSIARVDVLKDATATMLYGDRAANGVIVVETERTTGGKPTLKYNFVPDFSFADLSSMNLCNAWQKLELERIAGCYDSKAREYDQDYAYKLENVRRGVDSKWIEEPLRLSFSQQHSLALSGRAQNVDYNVSLSFNDSYGVMKGDNRRNFASNVRIGYHVADKLTVSYSNRYSYTANTLSPYGNFGNYATLNPYDPIHDADGQLIPIYYFYPFTPSRSSTKQGNPLYDASLSSFSTGKQNSFSNSISAKWYITKLFYLTGQFNLTLSNRRSDKFLSPLSSGQLTNPDTNKRGSYTLTGNDNTSYSGKLGVSYSKMFDPDRGTTLLVQASADINHENGDHYGMRTYGFFKDRINSFRDGQYSDLPTGGDSKSARVGFYGLANFNFRNRYSADLSYRTSGSSKYGANNRWAPMWAAGLSWNVKQESFFKEAGWIDQLRFRVTTGYEGKVSFSPYQALTTYSYAAKYDYWTGVGAVPITMGNPDLLWEKVLDTNFGLTAGFLGQRLTVTANYYIRKTIDMLVPIGLPASVGAQGVKANLGELRIQGFDLGVTVHAIKTRDFNWTTTINGTHTMDRIQKISNALKDLYFRPNRTEDNPNGDITAPYIRFREGKASSAIYAVRSAGIDPATGKEIYIKPDGTYTYNHKSEYEVVVGNSNPIMTGYWNNTLRYKNFMLNFTMNYSFGGDIYNSTLQQKVENIVVYQNVDARAYTDRWKTPGDLSRYLGIDLISNDPKKTERFVERNNYLSITRMAFNYEFSAKLLKKIGLKKMIVGIGANDIAYFSTVKRERGTEYPYCRSFDITFRPVF